jgi:hypothetical protein
MLIPDQGSDERQTATIAVLSPVERTTLATSSDAAYADGRHPGLGWRNRVAGRHLLSAGDLSGPSLGLEVIVEERQVSESASVDFGSAEVDEPRRDRRTLRIPIDLPLLTRV